MEKNNTPFNAETLFARFKQNVVLPDDALPPRITKLPSSKPPVMSSRLQKSL